MSINKVSDSGMKTMPTFTDRLREHLNMNENHAHIYRQA